MTDEKMALFELIEKRADHDFIREMLAFAADRLMGFEVEALTGAPLGAKSPDRLAQRNGLSRTGLGHPCGRDRSEDSATADRLVPSVVPRSPQDRREGARGGDPGGIRAGRLDTFGR